MLKNRLSFANEVYLYNLNMFFIDNSLSSKRIYEINYVDKLCQSQISCILIRTYDTFREQILLRTKQNYVKRSK